MNVLITGATGFVGSAVVTRFLRDGFKVAAAVLDGEDTSLLPMEVERKVVPPLSAETDYLAALQGMDLVVHLAARVHVMHDTAADPLLEFRRVNLFGTERLANQATKCGVHRFVFISTVKVLGEENPTPYREESPLHPLDAYGTSKAEAEAALRRIAEETGLEVVIARPPLVYGQGVKANFRQLLGLVGRGVPLPLASVRNRRSFVYVENLAEALFACATHPAAGGKTYLVSDGEDVSTPELIRRLASAFGKSARLLPFPVSLLRAAGGVVGRSAAVDRLIGSLQVDSSRIRGDLGWKPPFTMDQGLRKTADWFKTVR